MPQMTYFRRPALAGRSLKRPAQANIRGNLRRSDIDGSSPEPYFAGVTNGQTLDIEGVSGGVPTSVSVSIPANVQDQAYLATVISAINSSTGGINVLAFDAGGCIGLRSTIAGSSGRVRVTGGTAAKALGFDVAAQSFFSVGGDLNTSPEGRGLGQPNDASLPVPGENLNSDIMTRSLGRVMANTDVLYADLVRHEVVLKKIASITSPGVATSTYDLGTERVFTGLAPGAAKDLLAHLYFLIDTQTGQVSQSRVVDVRDQVAGTSLFGVPQSVTSALNISNILNGSVVECDTASFTGAGVQPGDFVQIDGSGSSNPFSNNGLRWVVEAVVDATHLALRPMSAAELGMVGTVLDENQPVVELNQNISGSAGTVTVLRSKFSTGARVVFSPPIPAGASFDLWAPVPASIHDREIQALADRGYGAFTSLVHDFDPLPNAILSRPNIPTPAGGATSMTVGPFMVRWHGRPVRVPGQTFTPGTGSATWYLYWDEVDCQLKASTSAGFLAAETRNGTSANELAGKTPNTNGKGLLVATVNVVSGTGVITSVAQASRLAAEFAAQITVGYGGQFPTLTEALEYLTRVRVSGVPRGDCEVIVLSTQTAPSGGWVLPGMPVAIRGATPMATLYPGATGPFFTGGASDYCLLSDFHLDLAGRTLITGAAMWWARNLTQIGGTSFRSQDGSHYVDIGAVALSVLLGKSGATTQVRGLLSVSENATFSGDVTVTSTKKVQVGARSAPGASLDVSGTQGRLVLSKTGEVDVVLTKDQLDTVTTVLLGGPAVNADSYHTHGAIQSGFSIGATGTTNGANVTAPNLNTLTGGGSADALHSHAHGDQAGGSLHAAATTSVAGFMSAADKTALGLKAVDTQVVHNIGNETINGVKTFGSSPIAPDLNVLTSPAGSVPNKKYTDGYTRAHVYGFRWPGALGTTSGATVTDGEYEYWTLGQKEIGTGSTDPGQLTALLGTKAGATRANMVTAPVTPITLPMLPLGKNGSPSKYRLYVRTRVNDATQGVLIYVNGVLIQGDAFTTANIGGANIAPGAGRLALINADAFARTGFNEQGKWREFFNLHGGLNGSGSVTQAEAAALASLTDGRASTNDDYYMNISYDWSADPDVPQTLAVIAWGVSRTVDSGGGNAQTYINLTAYDPTDISVYPYNLTMSATMFG